MSKPVRAAASPLKIDRQTLRQLVRTLERSGVTDFEYEDKDIKLRIGRGAPAHAAHPAAPLVSYAAPLAAATEAQRATAKADDDTIAFVTSPFVGTFYRAASPEAPPFVDPGSIVRPGQTMCIVEAMKLMNEIEADIAGTVLEILVENGKSVEFGQKLFKIKKA